MLKKLAILTVATAAFVAVTPAYAIVAGSGYALGAMKYGSEQVAAVQPSAIDRDAARSLMPNTPMKPAAPADGRSRALPFELAGLTLRPE